MRANGMNRAVNTIAAVLRSSRRCAHARIETHARLLGPRQRSTPIVRPIAIAGGIPRERGDGRDGDDRGDRRLTVHDRECGKGGDGGLAGDDDQECVAEHQREQQRQRPRACREVGQQIVDHRS